MQISKSTDYALRVLIYAASKPGIWVTQQEIADFFQISRDHLRKIVHELGKHNYVITHRGKNGGFELAMPPEKINIADIMVLFEPRVPLIDCSGMVCMLSASCVLKRVFNQAERDFMNTMRKYTLADIVNSPVKQLINP